MVAIMQIWRIHVKNENKNDLVVSLKMPACEQSFIRNIALIKDVMFINNARD